jgi:hypothetical protein
MDEMEKEWICSCYDVTCEDDACELEVLSPFSSTAAGVSQ